MKKIIYTLLVALMAFSFMGCPTIEVMEPELPANASWYYIDIPADAKNVIFNDGTNQTADIKGIDVSSGSIYYAWNSALAKDNPDHSFVFEPTDKPEGKAGRVWCYSSIVPNCYWWDCASEADNATWPGKPMTKNGETVKEDPVYNLILVVDGFNADDKVLVNGSVFGWNGWPFVGWLGWTDGVQDVEQAEKDAKSWIDSYADTQIVTADSDGVITMKVTLKTLVTDQKLKFVKTTITDGIYNSGDATGDIPLTLPEDGGTYLVKTTFSKGSTTPAVVY